MHILTNLTAVTMDTGMFIFCVYTDAHMHWFYQLSGWMKVWFIHLIIRHIILTLTLTALTLTEVSG